MQPDIAIDHFTLGARTLEEGALYLKDKLGIEMPLGSKHDTMSTHNRVLKAGDGLFFERLHLRDGEVLLGGRHSGTLAVRNVKSSP